MSVPSPRVPALLVAGVALAALSGAPTHARPQPAKQSLARPAPFLGAWDLDLSRMPDSYGPPPKHVRYTFEDIGAGRWRTTIDITARDGSLRHTTVSYRRDGAMAAGEGDTSEADSAAVNSPSPGILVMGLAKNRTLGSVRVYAVSADGKDMTESAASLTDAGAPFVRNFHFKRVR